MPYPKQPRVYRRCAECQDGFRVLASSKQIFCSKSCANQHAGRYRARPTEEATKARFWLGVRMGSDQNCWEWVKSRFKNGYGRFSFSGEIYAHRVSYLLNVGSIPNGMWVLHYCDNPACVNPQHLFIGTHQDNMDDMRRKGRASRRSDLSEGLKAWILSHPEEFRGEKNGRAKLTENEVRAIRKAYKRTAYKTSNSGLLAAKYGVCPNLILQIVARKRWPHV